MWHPPSGLSGSGGGCYKDRATEVKAEKEYEFLSAQNSREAMLGKIEKELLEKHNKEVNEAIKQKDRATEVKAEKECEFLSAQKSREAMLGKIEKELIEKHNKELNEAIKQSKAMIKHKKSIIESLERMKNINERRLATLKVKGTPYTPASEKPKKVKHTAGKHRGHGRKPPLHPSSKCQESSIETAPAQNLKSSKRLRTV
ncbi:hypothetical protein JCGZ_07848 [Jatropha curcas]|uniref:Uncharacterized protein n=1 Tax=Jatropha curcas TaxID=180498 RepID=A0A067KRM6_JATCU|nr:hypothetical protein JCGZ_07848 [Jatropha curcas]